MRTAPMAPLPNSGPHTCRVPTPTSEAVEFKERMFEDGMLEALGNCLRGCDYEEDRCNAAGAMLNFAYVEQDLGQEHEDAAKLNVKRLFAACFDCLVEQLAKVEIDDVAEVAASVVEQMLNSGETTTEWNILRSLRRANTNPNNPTPTSNPNPTPNPNPDPDPDPDPNPNPNQLVSRGTAPDAC